ncbi:MAG TPA: alkaline phosphatase [Saprospiraceae bacterium]|nr:alkaline phosphatase [Saprospiraceae bacterium]
MKNLKISVLFVCLLCSSACGVQQAKQAINSEKQSTLAQKPKATPKNIILMIGDGMGISQITAGMYSNNNYLELERCTHIGLHKQHASDNLITDSAAGATVFSIGRKSNNKYLGLDSLGNPHQTILEYLSSKKYKTGLLVTSTIVHATPAAFYAHQKSRNDYEKIAVDLMATDVDLLIGGGKKYFNRRMTDSLDLIEVLKNRDYLVQDYFDQDLNNWIFPIGQKLAFFTADGDPEKQSKGRNYLPSATAKSIAFLNQPNAKGFFLMVEGSQIDWGGHDNDANYIIAEMLDFDKAIKAALDFAQADQNTLVIITADHETGGLAIIGGKKFGDLKTAFTTENHTADLIPVFAYGPGAELFSGIYENTEIYNKMMQLMGKD